jgi:hypothetical protein
VLGPDYYITLGTAGALTLALARLGEAESGRVLGQDTLERCRRVLGLNHPITLWAATGLTLALARLGEAEPGRVLGQDTLERCRRILGPDHPIAQYLAHAASSGHLLLDDDAAADLRRRPL